MDRAPGRIGFMSTQRLAGRQPVSEVPKQSGSAGAAQVEIAPPLHAALRATSSLPSDYRILLLEHRSGSPPGEAVNRATANLRSSFLPMPSSARARFHLTLPLWAKPQIMCPVQLSTGSPLPDGRGDLSVSAWGYIVCSFAMLPAALSCRTERYDGKGNLYLQHAA